MSELKNRIYEILGRPQLASLATVTRDGKPWVRYVIALASEDFTIRFATSIKARKVDQIKNNPEVHLTCGVNDPVKIAPYLQIQGKAVLHTEQDIKNEFWNDTLNKIFQGPDDPNYAVIQVDPYKIEYCTPESFEPEVWTSI
jgi:general stress protein 26